MDLDSYTTVVDDRRYIDPNAALSEQQAFMNNIRDLQQQNNQQIQTDTYNLGTDIASNLGGLTGGESYFASRIQPAQTNALVADLRSTAQAQALTQAMQNELAKAKQRYQNAYKAAKKRYGVLYGGSGSGSGGSDDDKKKNKDTWDGEDVGTKTTDDKNDNNGGTTPPNIANFLE